MKPLFSIIIPVYNTESYLQKCLDSVLNQTFQDFEIICIDDCSRDNSLNILHQYADKNPKIKLIELKENLKQGGARNKGLEIAQGKYIVFVDSDDFISDKMLEFFHDKITAKECDCIVSHIETFCDSENENDKKLKMNLTSFYESVNLTQRYYQFNGEFMRFRSGPVAKLFKKSIIDKYNIRFPEKLIHEDEAFHWYYFSVIKNIFLTNNAFYYRRVHENCTMAKKNETFAGALDIIKILEHIHTYLTENKLYEKYENEYKKYFSVYSKQLLDNCPKSQLPVAKEEISKLQTLYKINEMKKNPLKNLFSVEHKDFHRIIRILGLKFSIKI